MIVLAGLVIGALTGALVARRNDGNRLDMLQYAAGFAILFTILGLILTILIERIAA